MCSVYQGLVYFWPALYYVRTGSAVRLVVNPQSDRRPQADNSHICVLRYRCSYIGYYRIICGVIVCVIDL